jgi:ATP-binding cassette subfamily F protein 3
LILDEPTNHLDIVSKEILEQALLSYTGTVLFVSHDRYFVNTVATGILDLSHGEIVRYNGGYDYYLEKRDETNLRLFGTTGRNAAFTGFAVKDQAAGALRPETEQKTDYLKRKEDQAKERKRKNDLAKVEKEINELEAKDASIDEEIQDPAIAADHHKLMELNEKKAAVQKRLEELMEIWEELMD